MSLAEPRRTTRTMTLLVALVLAGAWSLAACGGSVAPGAADPPHARAAVVSSPPRQAPRPTITKILTFVVENHSLRQMRTSMPFVFHLAKKFAYADHYTAITHPSLPNYLAMFSGSTQGVVDDADPDAHPLSGQTVFDQALEQGGTATVYADAMRRSCQLRSRGTYAVRHNPWVYFVEGRADCRRHDVPLRALAQDAEAGRLPQAGLVIPDLVHDAHDADLGTADAWIKRQIRTVQAGPDWRSGHLAIIVTADEDDYSGDNRVLTVVASRYQAHKVVHAPLTHYSLTRLYDSVLGAPYLGAAADAASMGRAFGLRSGHGG